MMIVEKAAKKTSLRKRMTSDARRGQIVKVAMTLFAKKGFNGTTTREIASKAGISEAVIFRHFAKKEDLYKAIIDLKCADNGEASCLMNTLKDLKGREFFMAFASYIFTEHRKDQTLLRILTYSALEGQGFSKYFVKNMGLELLSLVNKKISEMMQHGTFRKANALIAARAFMGMVLHYSVSQEMYGLKKHFKSPDNKVIDTFVDIFFNGLLRR